jgi:hypothetical protein
MAGNKVRMIERFRESIWLIWLIENLKNGGSDSIKALYRVSQMSQMFMALVVERTWYVSVVTLDASGARARVYKTPYLSGLSGLLKKYIKNLTIDSITVFIALKVQARYKPDEPDRIMPRQFTAIKKPRSARGILPAICKGNYFEAVYGAAMYGEACSNCRTHAASTSKALRRATSTLSVPTCS